MSHPSESTATVQTLEAEGLTAKDIARSLEVAEPQVSALLQELIDAWRDELFELAGSSIEEP